MAERTARALSDCAQTGEDDPGWDVSVSRGFGEGKADLRAWTAHAWEASDALLFVGAAGIAVRAIAPHVASKTNDPAALPSRFCRGIWVVRTSLRKLWHAR